MSATDKRLRIVICIGGGPEAYTGLKFVHRLTQGDCADVSLLYVRPLDSGLKSGGMEVRVARENVLDWGIELPGMAHLNKAQKILEDLGNIEGASEKDWQHIAISGDPSGEFIREYKNSSGGQTTLHMRTAEDVTTAIIDEAERFNAQLIIVGGSPEPVEGLRKYLSPKQLALKITAHARCSVIVARQLEPGNGHLVCVQDNAQSRAMLPQAIRFALACNCPTSILSVAQDSESIASAQKAVNEAATLFQQAGITPSELLVEVGDPAEIITELGYDFSLIILAESEKPWFAKVFSVSHDVAIRARNSVMIVKNQSLNKQSSHES